MVTDELVAQADAAREEADEAKRQASRLLSMLARAGDGDLIASLLGEDSTGADSFLYRLETMDRLTEQSNTLYTEAVQLQNTAESLADQATIAREKRDELQVLAEEALAAAQAGDDRRRRGARRAAGPPGRAEGAAVGAGREAPGDREGLPRRASPRGRPPARPREAAERAAAEAAAAANGANSAGWARPSAGYISSGYGMRYHPIYHYWRLHNGTDIAGQGCGAADRRRPRRGRHLCRLERHARQLHPDQPRRRHVVGLRAHQVAAASSSATARACRPASRSRGSGRPARRPDATCTS